MLRLTDQLLLIALDDETGEINFNASQSIYYGLAGAVLLELKLEGCLNFDGKNIELKDGRHSEDPTLNELIRYIHEKSKGRPRKLKYWVQKLGGHIQYRKKHRLFIERLVERGILNKSEKKVFFFFTKDIYPSQNTGKENAIRERVHKVVLQDEEVDEKMAVLIGLIKACSLEKMVFSSHELKQAKKQINFIMKNNAHSKAVNDTIQEMQAAIFASIGAATAATISTNN